ncbi:hypothetical protein OG698_01135 [Streptomyces sp. NBC_01003]|uniref:hypothetical protein n=1 Tax=Streptomyces sp. NBC_01003 TaxID=2903714 RepID=UPI00386BAA4C|nr:hypothetical protein OG698_01135 [Streptomyces sp. NBC_01003]
MPGPRLDPLVLSKDERRTLEGWANRRRTALILIASTSPDLINAQRAAVEAYQALHPAHGGALRGYHSSRPATDGWTVEQSAEYDRLWAELRRTATVVYAHKHWQRCGSQRPTDGPQAQPSSTLVLPSYPAHWYPHGP